MCLFAYASFKVHLKFPILLKAPKHNAWVRYVSELNLRGRASSSDGPQVLVAG